MHFQNFPTPRAWKRHTGRAHQVGLSAGALACLGTEPHAHEDPASFTGWIGTVKILGRDDTVTAGQLAAEAIGTGRGVVAKARDKYFYILHVPISKQAAQELAHAETHPEHSQPRPRCPHRGIRRDHADPQREPASRQTTSCRRSNHGISSNSGRHPSRQPARLKPIASQQ